MIDKMRKKIFLLSGISNYAAICVSIIVGIISIPVGLHYFGPARYGIWLVISSILAYLRLTDFGIGLSMLTLLSQTSNPYHHRVIIYRSISLLILISAICVLVTVILTFLFPDWIGIIGKIPLGLREETFLASLIIIILTFFQMPTTIFSSAFYGLQQIYWNRFYSALYAIVVFLGLLTTVMVRGDLITLAIFTGIGGLAVGILSGVHLFLAHPQIRLRSNKEEISAPPTKLLLISGTRFLFLQIASLIILNSDNLIISNYLGPEKVIPFAVSFKLFYTGLTVVTATIIALWPMYGEAFGRGDWPWIQRTYNRSVFLQIIPGGLILVGGIVFSELIITLWAGPAAYSGLFVISALGGYVYISSFGGVNHSLINGLNPTNIVVVFGLIEAALNLTISLILVKPFGVAGVVFGLFLASLAVNTIFPPLYIYYRTAKKVNLDLKPVLMHVIVVIVCTVLAIMSVLYSPAGWTRFSFGIMVIILYLFLSWFITPKIFQDLVKQYSIRALSIAKIKIKEI